MCIKGTNIKTDPTMSISQIVRSAVIHEPNMINNDVWLCLYALQRLGYDIRPELLDEIKVDKPFGVWAILKAIKRIKKKWDVCSKCRTGKLVVEVVTGVHKCPLCGWTGYDPLFDVMRSLKQKGVK